MVSVVFQLQQAMAGHHTETAKCAICRHMCVTGFCHQAILPPVQGRPFQSLLYIHVITAVVCDNDTEVGILGDSEQLFHVGDELQYPTCLVFH